MNNNISQCSNENYYICITIIRITIIKNDLICHENACNNC